MATRQQSTMRAAAARSRRGQRAGLLASVLLAILGFAVLCTSATRSAVAAATEVRFVQQYGLSYLSFMVMQEQKLVEQSLAKRGLSAVKVTWATLGGPSAMMEAVLAGQVDFIAPGAPTLATMWDKTVGTPREIRALSALNNMPEVLVSRNPRVRSIVDFTESDRIALPAIKVTAQAIILQMAAAKQWGEKNFEKLDHLTISRSHPDAVIAMYSANSEITAHFGIPPFYQQELRDSRFHQVLSSYDVMGGKHTNGLLLTSKAFYDANGPICEAVFEALETANAFIRANPPQAADLYLRLTKDKHNSTEDVQKMIEDPDIEFTKVPARVMQFVSFMHAQGRIKNRPASWKDLFFPIAHGLDGS